MRPRPRWYVPLLVACTLVAAWLAWPAFEEGRLCALDAPRHLLRTQVLARQFLPAGHVDGWSPWWFLGAQLFLFQSYGVFLLLGGAAWLLDGLVPLEAVFKVGYVLPLVVLPWAAAHLARRLGVLPRGALGAAVAATAFSSGAGYGVEGLFGVGLLLQAVGVVGIAFALPAGMDAVEGRSAGPWKAAIGAAAVVLVHFVSGAWLLAALGFVALVESLRTRTARPLARYAAVAGVCLLLCAHALLPSLQERDLAGTAVTWVGFVRTPGAWMAGGLVGARPLAVAALVAAAVLLVGVRRGHGRLRVAALLLFGTGLLATSQPLAQEPHAVARLLGVLARPRFLPYAVLLQAVFAGLALEGMLVGCEAGMRRWTQGAASSRILAARRALQAGVMVAFLAPAAWQWIALRPTVRTEQDLVSPDRQSYRELVSWLRQNVAPPSLLAVPRDLFPEHIGGAPSVLSLLNLDTGLFTLDGDQAELTRRTLGGAWAKDDWIRNNPMRQAESLRMAGVSHVLVSNPATRRRLESEADYELLWEFDPPRPARTIEGARTLAGVGVYRLRGGGQRLHAAGLEVRSMHFEPERVEWEVEGPGWGTPQAAEAAINWHPAWQASVDGRPVPTRMTAARRIAFDVPPGAARVVLEFVRGPRERATNLLSLATLMLVLAAWARRAGRARRNDGGTRGQGPSPVLQDASEEACHEM